MLEARGLSKFYGSVLAVRDISFSLQPGQVLGYLGPNGSGKSTTVKMLTGLIGAPYLFGYVFFTYHLPQMENWSLSDPGRTIWFAPLLLTVLGGIHFYRKQMLDKDKELVFEDVSASGFD